MRKAPNKTTWEPRLIVLIGFITLGFFAVFFRLVTLQGFDGPQWASRAARGHERILEVEGERGRIFDRNGQSLAVNVEVPSIFAAPSLIGDPQDTAQRLAVLLGEKQPSLLKRIQAKKGFVWVRRKIEPAHMDEISQLGLPGIGVVMERQRVYPKRLLLGQTLGFANIDNQGLEGVELKYNQVLQGDRGRIIFQRDARGKLVFPKDFSYRMPASGKDLYLTVDEVIQHVSERELDRAMESTKAKGGTVIVMDPHTGEILSMAVRPEFNPNARDGRYPGQWRNRPITDFYEPGSTFKIFTTAGALEEGVVHLDESIFCENGKLRFAGGVLRDHHPFDWLTFREVFAKSSNIGIAKVAMRLGPERLIRYISAFGFGEKTGIDLPGEVTGKVRPISHWSGRSLAMLSIGQEIGVTPIQIITAMGAIANGGYLMTPSIVRAVQDDDGKTVETYGPSVRRKVITGETALKMKELLEQVVLPGGTGEKAALSGYRVAGKTGTAQKFDPVSKSYATGRFVSSFLGFAPVEDPKVVILVILDEPKGVVWGGAIAAPVFRAIAKDALHYLGIPHHTSPKMVVANASLKMD